MSQALHLLYGLAGLGLWLRSQRWPHETSVPKVIILGGAPDVGLRLKTSPEILHSRPWVVTGAWRSFEVLRHRPPLLFLCQLGFIMTSESCTRESSHSLSFCQHPLPLCRFGQRWSLESHPVFLPQWVPRWLLCTPVVPGQVTHLCTDFCAA